MRVVAAGNAKAKAWLAAAGRAHRVEGKNSEQAHSRFAVALAVGNASRSRGCWADRRFRDYEPSRVLFWGHQQV
eukprot:COSAG02_NODE_36186_length_458_cov_0.576602_1_plen_73_part_01